MKKINVVGAIIKRGNDILIAQRKKGDLAGLWEFPGGKIEVGETPEQALIREMKEEMEVNIQVNEYITTAKYDYPTFSLHMDCFLCSLTDEISNLNDHTAIQWIPISSDINSIKWVPADIQVFEAIQAKFK